MSEETPFKARTVEFGDPVIDDGEVKVPLEIEGEWSVGGHYGSKEANDQILMSADELHDHVVDTEEAINKISEATINDA